MTDERIAKELVRRGFTKMNLDAFYERGGVTILLDDMIGDTLRIYCKPHKSIRSDNKHEFEQALDSSLPVYFSNVNVKSEPDPETGEDKGVVEVRVSMPIDSANVTDDDVSVSRYVDRLLGLESDIMDVYNTFIWS